jgi:hypothetical protein
MNERPTPETDTETVTTDYLTGEPVVPAAFARRLERERDALREELEDWRNAAKGAENPHPAAHMAAMKEAIREAHSALNNAAGKLANPYGICQDQTSDEYAAGLDCENALTKLKPFLDQ